MPILITSLNFELKLELPLSIISQDNTFIIVSINYTNTILMITYIS
jgi:hypothetical protein